MEITDEFLDVYNEFFPSGVKQFLEGPDLVAYNIMIRVLSRKEYYTMQQIFYLIKEAGVDEALQMSGFQRMSIYAPTDRVSVVRTLNNLWWDGKVRKFGRGIYNRTGRPYGVVWMII